MKKLFIIFAILCLAAPAMAADWNFYGSARFATFWSDLDGDTNDPRDDDEGLQWAQQGNSRIGATVKFNDQIGGGFEMSDSFGKRKLYGTYTMGNGSQLLIGQTYTPSALFYSNSVFDGDGDLLGIGEFYEGRLPMLQWKMGGLKVALIKPNEGGALSDDDDNAWYGYYDPANGNFVNDGQYTATAAAARNKALGADIHLFQTAPATGAFSYDDVDVSLPKIEVGYGFKADMFFADVFAGYQTYELESDQTTNTIDVDSYVIGGGVGANFGAFYVKVGVHMGQNLGNYGAYIPGPLGEDGADIPLSAELNAAGTDVDDSDGLGYLAVAGFNVSEMLTIEAGYGHEEAEIDVNGAPTVEGDQYYLNATINIAPGFFVVPEVGMIQTSEDNVNAEPETFYMGAKWQINF